jgi:hypothetical protein
MTRQAGTVKVSSSARLVQGCLGLWVTLTIEGLYCTTTSPHSTVYGRSLIFSPCPRTLRPRGFVVSVTNFSREELGLDYSAP